MDLVIGVIGLPSQAAFLAFFKKAAQLGGIGLIGAQLDRINPG